MKRLTECLNNQYGSYILPFFWQHGETHNELAEEIDAICRSGCKEFCVESRIFEDFCGKSWWEDFGFILKEAQKRNMRVWLLDDKKFPTGYANGLVEKRHDLKKKYIKIDYVDVIGPRPENAVMPGKLQENDRIICVTAYKRTGQGEDVEGDGIALDIQEGLVFFDIPDGVWRVYFVIETEHTDQGYENYINMLNYDSCSLQIEAVYEPHYVHFKEYFGNTFAGFFSDEPSFTNDSWNYDSKLGKKNMLIPWSESLPEIFAEKANASIDEIFKLLPLLWAEHGDKKSNIRYVYMDTVSEMYKNNFSLQIGNWCHERGVMHIGHVIEDMNAHMRLGYGAGHFFRAMSGQDMPGCDIVLNQMIPGIKECLHTASVFDNCVDPEFFSYTLAKLASSDAHLDRDKHNRAFCEIFGAFGWAEGVPMMKLLADHMLVGGINYFVPHAFDIKYPDPDCPPHFYAGGNNPQSEYFSKLMRYMQRMSHILSGGIHQTRIAVLYNAEGEWCSGKYELFQKVSKILLQNQLDFDFVPSDMLRDPCICNDELIINEAKYKTLIISYSEILPQSLIDNLKYLADSGVDIIFCEEFPERSAEGRTVDMKNCRRLKTKDLPEYLIKCGYNDIMLLKPHKYLRYYHIKNENKDIYMFSNEDIFNETDVFIHTKNTGEYIEYNAWKNEVIYRKTQGAHLRVKLGCGESTIIIFEEHNKPIDEDSKPEDISAVNTVWDIYIEEDGILTFVDRTDQLHNFARKMPYFCGKIRYECEIDFDSEPQQIQLGSVGEIAELYINGKSCGDALHYPYKFDIAGKCNAGKNKLRIDVITNVAYRERDEFSKYLSLPPMGMIGPVKIIYKQKKEEENDKVL